MAGKEAKNAKVKNELGGYIDLAPSSTRSKMSGIGGFISCGFILFVI